MTTTNPTSTSPISLTIEKNRYRLYAAYSCPFAHRVRLARLLASPDWEEAIDVTFLTGHTTADGLIFETGLSEDPEFHAQSLKEVYAKLDPTYDGKMSVPLLMDRKTRTMVSNDSIELAYAIVNTSSTSSSLAAPEGSKALAKGLNVSITTAPYKWLQTSDVKAKQDIADEFWNELNKMDDILANQSFLLGDSISIPDLILWITLIRYENVYNSQFGFISKDKHLGEYQNLCEFIKRIWATPSPSGNTTLGEEANITEIIRSMWQSEPISGVVGHDPKSPVPDLVPVLEGI